MTFAAASASDIQEVNTLLAIIADPQAAKERLDVIATAQAELAAQQGALVEQEVRLKAGQDALAAQLAEVEGVQRAHNLAAARLERRVFDFDARKADFDAQKAARARLDQDLRDLEAAIGRREAAQAVAERDLAARLAAVVEREAAVEAAAKRLSDAVTSTRL